MLIQAIHKRRLSTGHMPSYETTDKLQDLMYVDRIVMCMWQATLTLSNGHRPVGHAGLMPWEGNLTSWALILE